MCLRQRGLHRSRKNFNNTRGNGQNHSLVEQQHFQGNAHLPNNPKLRFYECADSTFQPLPVVFAQLCLAGVRDAVDSTSRCGQRISSAVPSSAYPSTGVFDLFFIIITAGHIWKFVTRHIRHNCRCDTRIPGQILAGESPDVFLCLARSCGTMCR